MNHFRPVTIIGGGLAGLALGIALRQRQVPVTLHEAGSYPRHRVCGEFISGDGLAILKQLGLRKKILEAGARIARNAAFYFSNGKVLQRQLPRPALCLSRYKLDALMAEELGRMGGTLHLNSRHHGDMSFEGLVRATGRRVQIRADGWRWFGLKAHAGNVELQADLELHFIPNGYVGLCRLDFATVNVCGLFRTRQSLPTLGSQWKNAISGPEDSTLRLRLATAQWDESSFCAVAGLSFDRACPSRSLDCAVGDTMAVISPLAGNGMSMAMESASLAAGELEAYSKGTLNWNSACQRLNRLRKATFDSRLYQAWWLQRVLMTPGASGAFAVLARGFPLWPRLFFGTR